MTAKEILIQLAESDPYWMTLTTAMLTLGPLAAVK